jgi:DNA-binding HxlR family transcriptional regulator
MSGIRYTQFCALARAAEIVGERWTLLIIRELLLGPRRFSDLADRLTGVSPTVLTTRLAALVERGVVRRAAGPPPFNLQLYELTEIGRGLRPAIRELIRWGGHFLFPMRPDDAFEPDWVLLGLDAVTRQTPTPARVVALHVRHGSKGADFIVRGGPQGTTIEHGGVSGDAAVTARFDVLLRFLSTHLTMDEAIAGGARFEGSLPAAADLPLLFDLSDRRGAA